MNVNALSYSSFFACNKLQQHNITADNKLITSRTNENQYNFASYPDCYYLNQLSFGRSKQLPHSEIIEKIGRENFPSQRIADRFEAEKERPLYEIHMEYYKDLLDCKTLEEAKEKYPEFEQVKDAKELNIDELEKGSVFRRIEKGKIENLSLENVSLELLKRQYGELKSPRNSENYFNIKQLTVYNMFKTLNIPKPDTEYIRNCNFSNPEYKQKQSEITQEMWDNDDGTRREIARNSASTYLQTTESRNALKESMARPESKAKRAENTRNFMSKPEQKERARLHASTVLQTPEVIAKRNLKLQSDEYRQAASEGYTRHPEITETMSKIAQKNPLIGSCIHHLKEGTANDYEKAVLAGYYLECATAIPGFQKIAGQEKHKILVERGLIKE